MRNLLRNLATGEVIEPPPPPPPPPSGDFKRPVNSLNLVGVRGLNYPPEAPWPGDRGAGLDIVVKADWATITAAVNEVTNAQAAAGAIIRVADGDLNTGNGSRTAGERGPLSSIGKASWTRPVVVVPLNHGKVTISKTVSLRDAYNVYLGGFKFIRPAGYGQMNTINSGFFWVKPYGVNMTGHNVDWIMYEVVAGYTRKWLDNPEADAVADSVQIRPADIKEIYGFKAGAGTNTGGRRVGCDTGPSYKFINDDAHTDTIQMERASGTPIEYGDLLIEYCVDYASTNQTYLLAGNKGGGVVGVTFRHSWGWAGQKARLVFPLYRESDTRKDHDYSQINQVKGVTFGTLFQGGATNVDAFDSYFYGSYGGQKYRRVERSFRDKAPVLASSKPQFGSWGIMPELADYTLAQMLAVAPAPTDSYCASVWRWK